jgi:hypothetical protein
VELQAPVKSPCCQSLGGKFRLTWWVDATLEGGPASHSGLRIWDLEVSWIMHTCGASMLVCGRSVSLGCTYHIRTCWGSTVWEISKSGTASHVRVSQVEIRYK